MDTETGLSSIEPGVTRSQLKFPVVGLGASAGGLIAAKRFL